MLRICPKCSYVRKETDEAPDWQCPSCQVAYNKVGGEPVSANYGRYGAPVVRPIRETQGFPLLKWILAAVLLGGAVWVGRPMLLSKPAGKAAATSSVSQPEIVLYGTEWCGYCNAARDFFDRNGIAYTDLDIEKTTRGYEEYKKLGYTGVPVFVMGDDVVHGYSEQNIRTILRPWLKQASARRE